MLRILGSASVFLFCVAVFAACGGSAHFTPAARAAITTAQRHDNLLRIFPDRPGTITCRILVSGPVRGFETGRCTTHVSMTPKRTRLDFIEHTSAGSGGVGSFTVILDRHRIVHESFHGSVPQMQL
jgi:hypothetical protein